MKPQFAASLTALRRDAAAHGIEPGYFDNTGRRQFASEETLRALLEKLGGSGSEPISAIEPVNVCWQNRRVAIPVQMKAAGLRRAHIALQPETGSPEPLKHPQIRASKNAHGSILSFPNPTVGYHTLSIETKKGLETSLLISAPVRFYADDTKRWGAFLPLYAVHSQNSWGAGNLRDWEQLARWLASQGAGVAGTLPVMASFLDRPICEPSPYSPASRLFWNEFFIDVTRVPEFDASYRAQQRVRAGRFQAELRSLRKAEFIDYRREWRVRREILELLADEFFSTPSARHKSFQRFIYSRPEVLDYATFRAACDHSDRPWMDWRAAAKNGRVGPADFLAQTRNFYLYIQWIAQEQLEEVLQTCRALDIRFYLDLPLGVNPDGFDCWRYRDYFAPETSTGAPPDSFFTKGQDWGFAPLCPRRSRELRYRYVIEYLRFQMRHTGLLRIDHVMGLHRLWWVPRGLPASAGAYVRYRSDELYAILSVESHLNKTTLVGENLGTVPPEVNESMDRHGLRRMYVFQYEQGPENPARPPDPREVASVNTHDMPSFAAWWKGLDILDRHALGLISQSSIAAEKKMRGRMRKTLIGTLRQKRLLSKKHADLKHVLRALLTFLARSDSETILVTLEDLWGETRPQNVPGTSTERPNWRRKTRLTLEEMRLDHDLATLFRQIDHARSHSPPPHIQALPGQGRAIRRPRHGKCKPNR